MKLLRTGPVGAERPAVLVDESTAYDVSAQVGDFDAAFFAGDGPARLDALLRDPAALPRIALEGQRIGPPISRPGKVVCIGLNYADHAAETGQALPTEPIVFFKASNTVIGPYDDVFLPRGSDRVDWEVELGVVIGRTCRYLPDPQAARETIAGYVVSNDVSERSFQFDRGGQWVKGKSCETFNPLGPWLVTVDEIVDPQDLQMWLTVNDTVMQQGSTKTMIFDVGYLVWYLSQFMVLEPGDLINTGTPPGVGMGRTPPRYLHDGDVMELSIAGLGAQRQTVRPAP